MPHAVRGRCVVDQLQTQREVRPRVLVDGTRVSPGADGACPFAVITVIDKKAQIGDGCNMCGACVQVCPEDAITIERKVRDVDLSKYSGVWVFDEVTDEN